MSAGSDKAVASSPDFGLSPKWIACLLAAYAAAMTGFAWRLLTDPRITGLDYVFGSMVALMLQSGDPAASSIRTPALPLFLWGLAVLDGGTLLAVVLKNLLVQPFFLWSLYRTAGRAPVRTLAIGLVLYVLTFPQLAITSYRVVPEEAWLIPLLAFVFHQLLHSRSGFSLPRYLLLGVLIAIILLIKSSTRVLCPTLVLLFFARDRDWRTGVLLASFCAAAFLVWGAFNYKATGQFRFASSLDGNNLYKGNNPRSLEFYPDRTLDNLSQYALELWDSGDEWAWHDKSVEKSIEFWRDQPASAYKLFLLRVYRCFLATAPADLQAKSPLLLTFRIVGIIYLFAFRVAFILCLAYAVAMVARSAWHRLRGPLAPGPREGRRVIDAMIFLGFTLAFTAPYLVGFAYERHILPLVLPTLMYALHLLDTEAELIRRVLTALLPGARAE